MVGVDVVGCTILANMTKSLSMVHLFAKILYSTRNDSFVAKDIIQGIPFIHKLDRQEMVIDESIELKDVYTSIRGVEIKNRVATL